MFSQFAKLFGVVFLIGAILTLLSFLTPDTFWGLGNIENLIRRTAMSCILAIGVAFVIMTGGIDLSIGAIVCLAACLFNVLLTVTYVPFDSAEVTRINQSEQTISLNAVQEDFQVGEKIRLNGARRAGNGIYTIASVGTANNPNGRVVTSITVEEKFQADDRSGLVSHTYPIKVMEGTEEKSKFQVMGDLEDVNPRDQLVLIRSENGLVKGLKNEPILEVAHTKNSLTVSVARLPEVEADMSETDLPEDDEEGKPDEAEAEKEVPNVEWIAIIQERRQRMPILAGLILVMLAAVILGVTHGVLITKLNLQPFIVTLSGFMIYRGLGRWLLNDQPEGFSEHADQIGFLGAGKLELFTWNGVTFGIPYPFFFLLAIVIMAAVFLNLTVWGRYILALGRNEEATRYSGVQTDRLTILAYVICAVLAAIGGLLFALDSNSVGPDTFGNLFELYAIAAAVLGGCSLRGGEGSIFGVVLGTLLMQLIYNMINLLDISPTLEYVIIGAVILAAAISDELLRIVANRRGALAAK